ITWSVIGRGPWRDGVVPFRVKGVALNVEGGHFSGGDLDALLVSVGVQFALDRQAGRCGGSGDQVDHGQAAGQGTATPVLRDMAEKAMLDLVPLRGSGREMAPRDRQPGLVSQFLKPTLPQPHAGSIGAAAVGR